MKSNHFIAIDVETTGLWPKRGDRIIEIGALAIENGAVVAEFGSLVGTNRPISKEAQKIHGITPEMLIGKPRGEEIMPIFLEFIGDGILIAHNAPFDMAFIRREFQRQNLVLNNRFICTLEMSRKRFPFLNNHKLDTIYKHVLGTKLQKGTFSENPQGSKRTGTCSGSLQGSERVPGTQTHRAIADARMVAAIWMTMER